MRELQNLLCGPNVMILAPIEFFAGPHNLLGLGVPQKKLDPRQKRAFGPKWNFAISSNTNPRKITPFR